MTYRIHLKSDYNPALRRTHNQQRHRLPRLITWGLAGLLVSFIATIIVWTKLLSTSTNLGEDMVISAVEDKQAQQIATTDVEYTSNFDEHIHVLSPPSAQQLNNEEKGSSPWKYIYVKPDENLSLIFNRMQISPTILHQVMTASPDSISLKNLLPGQELRFLVEEGELKILEYEKDFTNVLRVSRVNNKYVTSILKSNLQKNIKHAHAIIDSSLFLAGQKAGLSDNLIMQLVAIYGWDIDFVLDIRKGDQFRIIYEETYKDAIKVSEGPILAAEFINNKKLFKAIRYLSPDGISNYFSDTGASMRKEFIRTPLNFTRISSKFSLNRRHPVLNTIRAHKGVDYAAPSGTPVKTAGDGTIISIGTNGGYGRVIEIKHGGTYSTLYAHLSKFTRGLKKGSKVKQGQIIGYVGRSGLATGPHLHYEFRVNGVHRNPLTVQLPKAESIPKNLLADFKKQSEPLLDQLNNLSKKEALLIALKKQGEIEQKQLPENL